MWNKFYNVLPLAWSFDCKINVFFSTDRLSTGFAVADIDLSKVEAVRTKMPISEVTMSHVPSLYLRRSTPEAVLLLLM
jgi:hypothetical protein